MGNAQQVEEQHFVEEVGVAFERTGLPRMAGRILGSLFISDPPYQSAVELADVLQASKGSISTMTRHLIQLGFIERFSMPGVRHDYFQLRTNAWEKLIGHGLEDKIRICRQLAEHGLELLAGKPPVTRKWLTEMRDIYAFLDKELPVLIGRWEQKRNKGKISVK